MLKKFFFVTLIVSIAATAWLHTQYGLDYIARVYIKQESSTDDFKWKPEIKLAPSSNPYSFEKRPAPEHVRSVLELGAPIDNLDDFLVSNGTTAFIVVKDGAVIYEAHYNGHSRGELVGTLSVSKSAFSIILGQSLEQDQSLKFNDPISKYVSELIHIDNRFSEITVADLIDMRSGIGFSTDVSFPFFDEDQPLVYYSSDLRKTLIRHPRIASESGVFHYGDYNPNLIALGLERATQKPWKELFQANLWSKIGAEYPAAWSTDYRGFPLVESGLAAAPIDLAKIGQAMLNNQASNGSELLIPKDWHIRSTERQKPQPKDIYDGRNWGYRNGWWIIARKDEAADYTAMGHLGQYIYVSPSNNIVIVRTGNDRIGLNDDDFTEIFYKAVEKL